MIVHDGETDGMTLSVFEISAERTDTVLSCQSARLGYNLTFGARLVQTVNQSTVNTAFGESASRDFKNVLMLVGVTQQINNE